MLPPLVAWLLRKDDTQVEKRNRSEGTLEQLELGMLAGCGEVYVHIFAHPHSTPTQPTTQVRSAATATLQASVVSAEPLGVLPGSLERGLREWMLPPLEGLCRKLGGAKGKKELPQV